MLATTLPQTARASEAYLTRTWQVAADGDSLLTIPVWYVTSDSDPESQVDMMGAPNDQHQTGMATGSNINVLSASGIRAEVSRYDLPKFELALDLRKFRRPDDLEEDITDESIIKAAIGCLQRIVGDMNIEPPIKTFTLAIRLPDEGSHAAWKKWAGQYRRIRVPWK